MSEAPTSPMAKLATQLEDIAKLFGDLNSDPPKTADQRKAILDNIKPKLEAIITDLQALGKPGAPAPVEKSLELNTDINELRSDESAGGGKGKSKSSRSAPKDKRKKKGGADINFDTMGSQVMNTGDLLNNQYMANLVPRAWDGPSPFSAGSTLAETITKGIPDSLVNAMDPPIVRGGGKKKSSSSKKSSSASKPSKSKK